MSVPLLIRASPTITTDGPTVITQVTGGPIVPGPVPPRDLGRSSGILSSLVGLSSGLVDFDVRLI